MDDFTWSHLLTWTDDVVYDDQRDAWLDWVSTTLADDPTLADLGWPSLYRSWSVSV